MEKNDRDRLRAFENMLEEIRVQADAQQKKMDRLRAEGKEKTATYRQYFGNRLLYRMMLEKYRQYGLLE